MENVLQKDVNQRFIEEINRLKANGKIKSEGKFAVQVGLSSSVISNIRHGTQPCNFNHLEAFRQFQDFDYGYVVTGIRAYEEKDIKMAVFNWMQEMERELTLMQRKMHNFDKLTKKLKPV